MSKGFGQAMGAGLATAFAIGAALFLTVFITDMVDTDLFAIAVFGTFLIAFMGAAVVGAVIGVAAGVRSREIGSALAAGLLCAVLGQLIILVAAFSAMGVVSATDDGADGIDADVAAAFDWQEFGPSLWFLLPAAIVGGVVAAATATPRIEPHEHTTSPPGGHHADEPWHEASAEAAPPVQAAPAQAAPAHAPRVARTGTPRLRCPRCHSVFDPVAGRDIVCPTCGFTG